MGIEMSSFLKMVKRVENNKKTPTIKPPDPLPLPEKTFRKKAYNVEVVKAWFKSQGIPPANFEYLFHPYRKWRFDISWPDAHLAVEVDGGIWINGGHNRGAQMLKTWTKENEGAILGYRMLRCQPKDICTVDFANLIKRAMKL